MKSAILVALATTALMTLSAQAEAAPVEYVKICTLYGEAWFYIPGKDTCVNINTGQTKTQTGGGTVTGVTASQQGIIDAQADAANARAAAEAAEMKADQAIEGVAISLAMRPAFVTAGHTYAMSLNVGTFGGKMALGLSGAIAASTNMTFTTSVGTGLQDGGVAGQAGVNFSW